ncbi:MAG: hypothetical protein K2P81_09585, partial [Bacteriovoracaceae bacterium]|nr:hypothetical protein [Bacteriovoracaceae bacterium]
MGTPLAYMESTASHEDVLNLASTLSAFSKVLESGQGVPKRFIPPGDLRLGELQTAYQSFY